LQEVREVSRFAGGTCLVGDDESSDLVGNALSNWQPVKLTTQLGGSCQSAVTSEIVKHCWSRV